MAAAAKSGTSKVYGPIRRWVYKASGFNKYGLYYHDVLYEYPHVAEALRRLPQDIKDERNFRISRALHLSMKKIYLPQEEWVTFDEDMEKGRYLQKYLNEVEAEIEEKKQWNKM